MNTQTQTSGTLQGELSFFTTPRRILIVGPDELLVHCLARLLTISRDLHVIRTDDSNPGNLAIKVAQLQPDVIILCQIESTLINNLVAVLDCVPSRADLSIIIVNAQNNDLHVYQHHHWFSTTQDAFIPLMYGMDT